MVSATPDARAAPRGLWLHGLDVLAAPTRSQPGLEPKRRASRSLGEGGDGGGGVGKSAGTARFYRSRTWKFAGECGDTTSTPRDCRAVANRETTPSAPRPIYAVVETWRETPDIAARVLGTLPPPRGYSATKAPGFASAELQIVLFSLRGFQQAVQAAGFLMSRGGTPRSIGRFRVYDPWFVKHIEFI